MRGRRPRGGALAALVLHAAPAAADPPRPTDYRSTVTSVTPATGAAALARRRPFAPALTLAAAAAVIGGCVLRLDVLWTMTGAVATNGGGAPR